MVKDPNCKNKNWKMEELDALVFDEIRQLALDPEAIHAARAENLKKNTVAAEKIAVIEKELHKLDAQISRFMDLYGIGQFTIDQVSSKVNPLNEQRKALQNELDSLTAETGELTEEETLQIVRAFDDILDSGDFDKIRLTIETLIYYIELDEDDVYIHWKFL